MKKMSKWKNAKKVLSSSRLIIQVLLFAIFLFLFALPAIETFQKKEVIVVESEKETGGFLAPSITILARDGWKGNATVEKCFPNEEQNTDQTIEECIDENTVNQSDVISDVFLGWD